MPVDFTMLEPDGLQVHIRLNSLLSKFGFFQGMAPERKKEFDTEFEKIISQYLPYED